LPIATFGPGTSRRLPTLRLHFLSSGKTPKSPSPRPIALSVSCALPGLLPPFRLRSCSLKSVPTTVPDSWPRTLACRSDRWHQDFIAGRAGYSVMIGQVTAGEPSLGVVYQPAAERLWLAERDRGAFEIVEDQPLARITVSAIHQIADARMVSSASTREELVEKVRTSAGIRDELQVGSVGVKLCLIASAARDIYMNPAGRCKLWDTAAPEVILQEAGGKLTDLRGSKLRYTDLDLGHHRGLVASNGLLHRDALRVLEPFLVGR
jgi:hypothetical protein